MNIQKKLEEHRKKKEEIIADMKTCITYTPDQENDLLCLMEQYLKTEKAAKEINLTWVTIKLGLQL